jgi:hypothetical protein
MSNAQIAQQSDKINLPRDLHFSEALILAQQQADESGSTVWLRELGRGDWRLSAHRCGYYNSTETRVDPL